ncbi:hypothetical protein P7K49_010251, partial [Saguinus oedipus]
VKPTHREESKGGELETHPGMYEHPQYKSHALQTSVLSAIIQAQHAGSIMQASGFPEFPK